MTEYERREGLCQMLVKLALFEHHTPEQLKALHRAYNALQMRNSAQKNKPRTAHMLF